MRTLTAFALTVLMATAPGCGEPTVPIEGCVEEAPAALDRSCAGDGECGDWLVCDEGACALPPAVTGADGEEIALVDSTGAEVASLRVEVARSDLARTRGLGHRPCIAEGWGMLIEFPTTGEHLIGTNTMRFDIDIAMIGEDGVVHTVHRDAPAGGKALYGADQPVKSVLETPADAIPIEAGQVVERR